RAASSCWRTCFIPRFAEFPPLGPLVSGALHEPVRRHDMSDEDERLADEAHRATMIALKRTQDEEVARRKEKRGLLLVHTGDGKGKSTAGFGLAMRAAGHGLPVAVVQF